MRSLARNVTNKAREAGIDILSTEGEDAGEWVLVDLGDVVVHIMRSEEHTSELQSLIDLVCRLLLEKKNLDL